MKAKDLPTYYNMCEILEHNLEHRADKIALFSEFGSLTFQEASNQVNQVGNALTRSGVRFGDCVAILSPDLPEWVITFFAIAKIGGIALGINTSLKTEEYDHIMRDARVRVLVVHASMLTLIESILCRHNALTKVIVIGVDEDDRYTKFTDWIALESNKLDAEPTHRDDFCSLHYSSGTTGLPKGVFHAHKVIWRGSL